MDTTEVHEENKENSDEYPISADPSKYVTLPVQNEKLWRKYQTTLEWFWTVYDVYLANDKENMTKTFNKEQCQYILHLLAFMFTTHYTTINKELFMQLMNQVEIKEASYYFGSQAESKKTHSMMYSMLLDELVSGDSNKKEELIREVVRMPQVRDFVRWSIQSTTCETKSFSQRLLAFSCIQGIIFTGPFVLFKWIQKQHPSIMPGLSNSNDLIWRDEKLNLSFSCMLFEYIDDELTEQEAHDIVRQAVTHAKNLLSIALPVSILGLDCKIMEQYIEHSADKILSDIHFNKLYNKESSIDWVEEPITETYQSKIPMNNAGDLSASFGEAKFSTDLDF